VIVGVELATELGVEDALDDRLGLVERCGDLLVLTRRFEASLDALPQILHDFL
jgi:hypothetical protein